VIHSLHIFGLKDLQYKVREISWILSDMPKKIVYEVDLVKNQHLGHRGVGRFPVLVFQTRGLEVWLLGYLRRCLQRYFQILRTFFRMFRRGDFDSLAYSASYCLWFPFFC